jgi:hypothetical protein
MLRFACATRVARCCYGMMPHVSAGYAAEWMHLVLSIPIERAMVRMQTTDTTLVRAFTASYHEGGISAMYSGWKTYIVLGLKPAIEYACYEQIKAAMLKRHPKTVGRGGAVVAATLALTGAEAFLVGAVSAPRAPSTPGPCPTATCPSTPQLPVPPPLAPQPPAKELPVPQLPSPRQLLPHQLPSHRHLPDCHLPHSHLPHNFVNHSLPHSYLLSFCRCSCPAPMLTPTQCFLPRRTIHLLVCHLICPIGIAGGTCSLDARLLSSDTR